MTIAPDSSIAVAPVASRRSSWPGSPPSRRLTVSTSLVTRCAAEPRRDRTARPPTTGDSPIESPLDLRERLDQRRRDRTEEVRYPGLVTRHALPLAVGSSLRGSPGRGRGRRPDREPRKVDVPAATVARLAMLETSRNTPEAPARSGWSPRERLPMSARPRGLRPGGPSSRRGHRSLTDSRSGRQRERRRRQQPSCLSRPSRRRSSAHPSQCATHLRSWGRQGAPHAPPLFVLVARRSPSPRTAPE